MSVPEGQGAMYARAKWALAAIALLLAAAQLIRPSLPNPPVSAEVDAPENVREALRRSCYDCHSNETHLRWYDQIVPAYWLVARDVRNGRARLNFSELGSLPKGAQRGRLFEAVNHARLGAMPPRSYTFVHRGAALTAEEIATLEHFLYPGEKEQVGSPDHAAPPPATTPSLPAERRSAILPAPNGLAFLSDFKDWKPVTTTDRFDNGSLRVILGNETTVEAIAKQKIHPWPDGSAFAKIAWKQRRDGARTAAGEFEQIEFMVKDARKYAETEGWGWGRWKGERLVPYGKDRSFEEECTGCHAPLHANDFVFTMPIANVAGSDLWNSNAALPPGLPFEPFSWRVIASSFDAASNTVSMLYGNDAAVSQARSRPFEPYSKGAILARVTWERQANPHWFGARMPGTFRLAELVSVVNGATGERSPYSYQAYEGRPARLAEAPDSETVAIQLKSIFDEQAFVMP